MAKVVIFGVLDTAQLAKFYLDTDSEHQVVAFTINRAYLQDTNLKGCRSLPLKNWKVLIHQIPFRCLFR